MRSAFPWPAITFALAVAGCSGPSEQVAAGLLFGTEPGNVAAGVVFSLTVNVVDQSGHVIRGASNVVTLALAANPGNATLSGTTTAAAVNGVATFPNLSLNRPGTGYSFSASTPGLPAQASQAFNVASGVATALVFNTLPTLVTSGLAITPAVTVSVQDALGNVVTTATPSISLGMAANPGNSVLSGTLTATAANGIATFNDVRLDKIGSGYRLAANSPGLPTGTSTAFSVRPGPASRLVFSVQPPGEAAVDAPFNVTVQALDAAGNLTDSQSPVTIAFGANPGGATLSGTTSVFTFDGIAGFTLTIHNTAAGYTLVASSTGVTSVTSNPFTIRAALNFAAVSAGYFHSCALLPGNQGYCWGQNNGKLGDGTVADRAFPIPVSGGIVFASISAGRNHSCGLTAAGVAYCWGENLNGELGDGTQLGRTVPTLVAGGLVFASLAAGYDHTCGVTLAGAAYCWGDNSAGALGDGSTSRRFAPVAVSGGLTFRSVSPGRAFTCGVTTANVGYCWGSNFNGELGDGTTAQRTFPVLVGGALSFNTIGAGGFHSCGLTTGGQTRCWGGNFSGQLGNGTTASATSPVVVSGGLVFTSVAVGNRHNCGLTAGGTAYCWGDNGDALLGDGSTISRSVPTLVAGGLTFTRISAGRFHTCGVATGNLGYCWGNNFSGQVGAGPLQVVLTPLLVR